MSLFNRIFPSRQQRRLIQAVSWADTALGDHAVWPLVRKDIVERIYHASSRDRQLGPARKDAANTVLYAAFKVASAEASSGHHHIYRGRLSMIGVGYRALALDALSHLSVGGFLTEEDAAFERNNVEADIATVG